MAPNKSHLKIVQTRSGVSTGDEIYQTEDGRWWKKNAFTGSVTGVTVGTKTNGHIKINP